MRLKGRTGRQQFRLELFLLLCGSVLVTVLLSYWIIHGAVLPRWIPSGKDTAENVKEAAADIRLDSRLERQIEDCLPQVLAAQISADFGTETLRAQAVIARSLLYWLLENADDTGAEALSEEWLAVQKIPCKSEKEIGADFSIFRQAVSDTEGYILEKDGAVILPLYHVCNAGQTRNGGETFPYLTPQESGMDLLVAGGLRVLWLTPEDFAFALSEAAGETITAEQLGLTDGSSAQKLQVQQDDAGYVENIQLAESIGATVKQVGGDSFATELGLPSSHYEWQLCDGKVRVTCRGIGHGYGFSQWGAQALYEQGKTWKELLSYYFPQTEIIKSE